MNQAADDIIVEEAVNEDGTQNVAIEAEEGRESAVETDLGMHNEEEGMKTEVETGMRVIVVTRSMINQENAMSINTVVSVHTRRDQALSVDFLMRNPEKMTTVGQTVEDRRTEEY